MIISLDEQIAWAETDFSHSAQARNMVALTNILVSLRQLKALTTALEEPTTDMLWKGANALKHEWLMASEADGLDWIAWAKATWLAMGTRQTSTPAAKLEL